MKFVFRALIFLLPTLLAVGVHAQNLQTGLNALDAENYPLAFSHLTPLAENGDARAQTYLGIMYGNGHGVPTDFAQALRLLRAAAAQENAIAELHLGFMYEGGDGVPSSIHKAVSWYHKAAEHGDEFAQYFMGFAYERGEGISQNFQLAHHWYLMAAKQNDSASHTALGNLYEFGDGVPENNILALMWYIIAVIHLDEYDRLNGGQEEKVSDMEYIEAKLTEAEISLAMDLVEICLASNYRECG